MNFFTEKEFLQYGAKREHLSKIVGAEFTILLKTYSLRRWIRTIYLVPYPTTLPIYKRLVIGV
tara:strand:- start:703 stop:891 length:189 start_codon:yes stop_codon:yes gene_type:complete